MLRGLDPKTTRANLDAIIQKAKDALQKDKDTIRLMGDPATWTDNILQLGIDLKTQGVMVSEDPANPGSHMYMIQVPGKAPYIVPKTDIVKAEGMRDNIWVSPNRWA